MPRMFDLDNGGTSGIAMMTASGWATRTLRASAAVATTAEASNTSSSISGVGGFGQAMILLDLTAAATEAGDTLDVYIDTTPDGTNWVNVIHFAQMLGNGGAKQFWAVLDRGTAGTATFVSATDAAVSVVRPAMFCDQLRVRYTTVDAATTGNLGFVFSVKGFFKV